MTEETFLDEDIAEDADDITLVENTIDVHTNKIERAWREVKRGLWNQPLVLLRRNINVEMFRYNNLQASVPFSEKQRIVLSTIAKHQHKLDELKAQTFTIYPEESVNSGFLLWFHKTKLFELFNLPKMVDGQIANHICPGLEGGNPDKGCR